MTATESTTKKWQAAAGLGPRMAKAVNEAFADFSFQAQAITEKLDSGDYSVIPMMGAKHPRYAELNQAICEKHGWTVTPDNYKAIIADIGEALKVLKADPVIVDKRTTPEERERREAARIEREQKEAAEAARIATMQTHVYDTPEAAKWLKRVLSIVWPSVKFSVKSDRYSGGYSITASWTDGPTATQVRELAQWFSNKHFDGMIDMETTTAPSEWNGHRFNIRGGYVSESRSISAEMLTRLANRFANETGIIAGINGSDPNYPYIERGGPCGWSLYTHDTEHPEGVLCRDEFANWTAADLIYQMGACSGMEPAYPLERDTVFKILLGEIGAAPAEKSELGQSAEGVTVTHNTEKGGLEIRFPDKPSQATLDTLKAHGWRWSRFSKCWWIKYSDHALAVANGIAGVN